MRYAHTHTAQRQSTFSNLQNHIQKALWVIIIYHYLLKSVSNYNFDNRFFRSFVRLPSPGALITELLPAFMVMCELCKSGVGVTIAQQDEIRSPSPIQSSHSKKKRRTFANPQIRRLNKSSRNATLFFFVALVSTKATISALGKVKTLI